jgi:Spy/CpxP family protein refolding chaperone
MRTHLICIGILMLLSAIILTPATDALAQRGSGFRGPHHGKGFCSSLTDEQRDAVHTMVREMRESGISREEIHASVGEALRGYGVELPKDWNEMPQRHRGPAPGEGRRGARHFSRLTQEQRDALRARRAELRESGATREEIRAAVREMLKSYGIEVPGKGKTAPTETPSSKSSGIYQGNPPLLSRNYPNPFNPVTHISYATDAEGKVRVQIYNVEGNLIRTFDEGHRPAGSYTLLWDGRHADGTPAASGVYFCRVEAGPRSTTNRMILLR